MATSGSFAGGSANDDPYETLGISRHASREEIRKKFQEMVRKFHPDKLGDGISQLEREARTNTFHKLSHAYHMLIDDVTRHQHDTEARAKEMTENLILYDTMCLSDMDMEGEEYTTSCRCGGVYIVDTAQCDNVTIEQHIIVPCDTCSLHIKIVFTNEL